MRASTYSREIELPCKEEMRDSRVRGDSTTLLLAMEVWTPKLLVAQTPLESVYLKGLLAVFVDRPGMEKLN